MVDVSGLIESRRDKIFVELPAGKGNIPVISALGRSLAEAWENSLLALYHYGAEIRTEYDRKDASGNYTDPPSRDCTMRMIVESPLSEPFLHRCFPGSLGDLEEYRQEVLFGIKDHWIRDPADPEDKRWEYTYHERLFSYTVPGINENVDQILNIIEGLSKSPISRRWQAITWKAWEDEGISDPPCLQSLWFRIIPDEHDIWWLNMNMRFRSRDAYDAAFMNDFAFISLMEYVGEEISKKANREVRLARFIDESDSYHIYGSRLKDFEERFIKLVQNRSFEERTWTKEFAEPFFTEARPKIKEKIKEHDKSSRSSGKSRGNR
jgi:thymidylate synthase